MTTKMFTDYGMVLVLIVLCIFFSLLTLNEQTLQDSDAIAGLIERITTEFNKSDIILTVGEVNKDSAPFAERLREELVEEGYDNTRVVVGIPRDLRLALDEIKGKGGRVTVIATSGDVPKWAVIERIGADYPEFSGCKVLAPASYMWPDFLKWSNLLAIVDRIVVIAVIAIGMTMVIITAGIDLSVGSLIALSAVLSTLLIRDLAGAEEASAFGMTLCCLAAIAACGLMGAFSGLMVSQFLIPPFIVTLAMMMVASGLAFILARGQSIYQVPDSLVWLGRGADLFGIPNTIVLMAILYAAAHIVMTRTVLGRYIYAVGGNKETARLSGVPVKPVLLTVYAVCGGLAGLGGIVLASQLKSGAPTYGLMYELYVIAAVVVGGTSLAGGRGTIIGTLIGAFIIAVIQNGMNLTGIESYTQKVVLGLVILGAVLLDMLKRRSWPGVRKMR